MASGIIIVHEVDNNYNLADQFTKSLPGWECVQLRSQTM